MSKNTSLPSITGPKKSTKNLQTPSSSSANLTLPIIPTRSEKSGDHVDFSQPGPQLLACGQFSAAKAKRDLEQAQLAIKIAEGKLAAKKRHEEKRLVTIAKKVRIGRKQDGLWKEGQISAREAENSCNGEFTHQYIATIANRLHNNEDLFPSAGRPSRIQSESFKTAVQKSAKKEEATGKGLRNVPMTNENSTAIMNSKASLGIIPGTVIEFFLREWKAFVAKEYPNGAPPYMANPLSAYEINKLTDEILPDSVMAKKKDRRNARRTQSQLDGYNYSSGAAGISVIWELEDVEHMDVKDLLELCKKLQIDPDQILNVDKSTALPGNKSEVRDRIQVTPGAKGRAHTRKVSIAASADENEDDGQATIAYTIGTTGLGNVWIHVTEVDM
jgi:hypothetical protein